MHDILIIGAGVTGCFLARELSKYKLDVIVLEKNNDVGNETSAANSAIVHSGYDPLPNTLKAKLNVLGNQMYDEVCKQLDVTFKRLGSITLAISPEDVVSLKKLQERATENGVKTQFLTREELLQKEPLISENVMAGLLAPTAGIIDPFNLCVHLMENAIDNGVSLVYNEKVEKIIKVDDHFLVNNKYETKIIINCAGICADTVNELINEKTFSIIPRKGEYYLLNHFPEPFVNHTLFLVPSDKGKGVLVSPTTSGNYLIGPSAEVVTKYDRKTDKQTLNEIKNEANKMLNDIPYFEVIRTFAGVRPTPDTHDFIIEESKTKGFINVSGIESPGLASSPAIAKYVIDNIISKMIDLKIKADFNPCIKKRLHIKSLSLQDKIKAFENNPLYGSIVCKCEQVSEGEIIDCLSSSCPPHSIEGLKRRLRVGFGKCQGGMCQADALAIMAKYYNVDKKDIPYDNKDSYILLSHSKEDN